MNDEVLRKNLLELLEMGGTHLTLDAALAGLEPSDAFRRPASADGAEQHHSAWELLEHMRITQEDIVRYTLDPNWASPEWPAGYWPEPSAIPPAEYGERFRATLEGFRSDLGEVLGWVSDPGMDLTAQIPHGEGRTYLRQVLLVADHNSYHLAQIVSARRFLRLWS